MAALRPPDILSLSASSLETWRRCRRAYRNQVLLSLPASDESAPPELGNAVHAILRLIHETGSCHDADHVRGVLDGHALSGEGAVLACVERHARRCPHPVDGGWHEVELARFHRRPGPMFMVVGRLDAVWIHDGLLDVRDYKTGSYPGTRVGDDPRARLQAWLVADRARRRGLRVRVRYEHLAPGVDEDPEPLEPDDDDLAAIGEELRATVAAIRSETAWEGVADPAVCGWCRYRSICPDRAGPAPAEPSWASPPHPRA